MIQSERQLTTKATTDSFDELYTNYDLSVNDTYTADVGYPFDYPTRWLNDPSMNKRIAIRRLDVTPTSHSFTIRIRADTSSEQNAITGFPALWVKSATIDVTEYDNLYQVMNFMCNTFSYSLTDYDKDATPLTGGLCYEFDSVENTLKLKFKDSDRTDVEFEIDAKEYDHDEFPEKIDNTISFLRFLNQTDILDKLDEIAEFTREKIFYDVWNRDRIHFHASFSTSRRHFIGKRGDFYQSLTLLYPPPTNESTFFIRFTTNGRKNILLRYCEFDIQLCYIVNYRKATIL